MQSGLIDKHNKLIRQFFSISRTATKEIEMGIAAIAKEIQRLPHHYTPNEEMDL